MDSNFLDDVAPEKAFYFHNGTTVRNIYELAKEISHADDELFNYHHKPEHDDFASWIGGAVGDIWLSQMLRSARDKEQYVRIITKRIRVLEKKHIAKQLNSMFSERMLTLLKEYSHVWLILFLMIITSIFTAMIYFEYHSLENIKALDEKINYMEERNSCFSDYFNEQLASTRKSIGDTKFDLSNYCVFNYSTTEKIAPDVLEDMPAKIPLGNISVSKESALIYVAGARISTFANSSSMIPVINHNTKALEITPNISELHIGDIISYRSGDELIVHRIVKIGYDDEGFYAVTRGDNNDAVDPKKVRASDIEGKIVAIIY